MKTAYAVITYVFLSVFLVSVSSKADVLADWTFETSQPLTGVVGGAWVTNIAPEVGSGTASSLHSDIAIYSPFPGNGSDYSFGVTNSWAVGDFFQFATSTVGYQNISMSFDQAGTVNGPGSFALEYSSDGTIYTQYATYSVQIGNWNSSTVNPASSFSFDLSSIVSLNNQSTVYFRIVDNSTVSIGGGTVNSAYPDDRIDNVVISAVPVPEPSCSALALCFLALGTLFRKHFSISAMRK